MKKVMILTNSLGRGGSELNAYKVTRILEQHIFDWYCLNLDSRDIISLVKKQKNIKQIVDLKFTNIKNIRFLLNLAKTLKEKNYSTIYAVGFMPSLIISIIKLGFGLKTKLITTRREMMPWKKFYHIPFVSLINYVSGNIETNSKAIFDNLKYEFFVNDKAYFVPNIILKPNRNEKMPFFSDKNVYIGTVSNVRKAKNIELFLEIALQIIQSTSNINFVIAGKDKHNMVQNFIDANNLLNRLFIYEDIDYENIDKFYNGLDIFLFTSIYEGSPNVIYEAINAGIPIVSSDIPATRELIVNNYNGFLVNLNSFDDFILKINSIIENDDLRRIMIKNNYKKSKELFTLDDIKSILNKKFT